MIFIPPTPSIRPILILLSIAGVAEWLGALFPMVGAPLAAILLGAAVAPVLQGHINLKPASRTSRPLLLWSLVLLGTGLDISQVVQAGSSVALTALTTVLFALGAAWIFARVLHVESTLATLVGTGTSICGGSAIIATADAIHAKESQTAQALSTIFLFNIMAAFLFPLAGHALGLSQHEFGLWAGTAINDTSSVLAASYAYGAASGQFGTIVKLTRTIAILPVTAVLSLRTESQGGEPFHWKRSIPWPVVGFSLAALAHGLVGNGHQALWSMTTGTGNVFLVLALAGIGLATSIPDLWKNGRRALTMGALSWIALSAFSLGLVVFHR